MSERKSIIKPVVIVGTGRCGTSIFYKILVRHPNIAYLTFLAEKYPSRPYLNRWFLHLMDLSFIESTFMKKHGPAECIEFCAQSNPAFIISCRDLRDDDVTNRMKIEMVNQFKQILTRKRYRLAIKRTGWPVMRYFLEIFPDVKFVHIIRDGRAVANSFLHIDWWRGWRGPNGWRFGELPLKYKKEWEKYNKSFVALAGIEWKIIMDAFEEAKKKIPKSQYLEIKYEYFIKDPIYVFKKVLEFIELPYTRSFEKKIKEYKLRNMNYKWRKDLTMHQQEILNEILKTHLEKYGYL